VWRNDTSWGYIEGGIGLNGRHDATVGIAYQHLSNAGIKQPNGGIDLYMITASFPIR
jgi:hypothetical protein